MSKRSKDTLQLDTLELTDFEKILDALSQQMVSVNQNGQSKRLTIEEAILQSNLKRALEGSTHAQNYLLSRLAELAEKKHLKFKKEIEEWKHYKANKRREFQHYQDEHGCDAEGILFPHPDDIEIDEQEGCLIRGPINTREYHLMQSSLEFRNALVLQWALDKRRSKCKHDAMEILGLFRLANLINLTVPERHQWDDRMFCHKMMEYNHLTLRTLLTETYKAWRKAGMPAKRGWKAPQTEEIDKMLNGVKQATKYILNTPDPKAEDVLHLLNW